jgi:hypothetical protein
VTNQEWNPTLLRSNIVTIQDEVQMVKSNPDSAVAAKVLEALSAIDAEANRKKAEQVTGLRTALAAINSRIHELERQRDQVEQAIGQISGRKILMQGRRPRDYLDELRERVVRWLISHPGKTYTARELHSEFPELKPFPSLVTFFKKAIAKGLIAVDKSGGPVRTRYTSLANE